MSEAKRRIRCAIYTRKSNEEGLEQDYNSLDAQRDAAEAYNGTHLGANVINKMLRNPIYVGKIQHKGDLYQGQHEALIEQEIWDEVQLAFIVAPRTRRGRPSIGDNKSVLHGLVSCQCCKSRMTHTYTRKKGRMYRYFTPSAPRRGRYSCTVDLLVRRIFPIISA